LETPATAATGTTRSAATAAPTPSPAEPGADLFHGSQDAGIDRVVDFKLAEDDRVMLDPGTTLSQVGADTVLDMGGGHQMILVRVQTASLPSGWIFGA
jgi:hypothetical protein